jgi:glycosyltransferase involved in cell wall biosynthesis
MSEIGVMHIVDTLALGGAERSAVNLVNSLPRESYRPYLCTTRTEGPLRDTVAGDVGRLALGRSGRFDSHAVRTLMNFVRNQNIAILHAHGSSLFIAVVAAWFPPFPLVIWHAHCGRLALEDHRAWIHRATARKVTGVIAVNKQLAEWCGRRLGLPQSKIWCIPNMVCASEFETEASDLEGAPGSRIICVANLRPEKDHINLVRAMSLVVRQHPSAHLLLVGAHSDPTYSASTTHFEQVRQEISRNSLERNISIVGQRRDIPALLKVCDIGVLSSSTEGLPVSLLEYGMAALPVVATRVGECDEVLDHGRAGILVAPGSPNDLAKALLSLLGSPDLRRSLGRKFLHRVQEFYSPNAVIERVCHIYESALAREAAEVA